MRPRIFYNLPNTWAPAQDLNPSGIETIFGIPIEVMLTYSDRLTLFALIVGLQPDCVLEIGTWQGGSATVIVNAMDSIQKCRLICLDPTPNMSHDHWKTIEHRATLVRAPSPYSIEEAFEAAHPLP